MSTTAANTIAIVDYGLGNLYSIRRACEHVGLEPRITSRAQDLEEADAVLLPGVGAFGDAMAALAARDLIRPIRELAEAGKPLIGICLGLQLLMSESHEFGLHQGLDLIAGTVTRLPDGSESGEPPRVKVPQVGWNALNAPAGRDWRGSPLEDLEDGTYLYFVHSFHVRPADPADVLALTRYGGYEFCSAVRRGNIFACQCHPERSGPAGLSVYRAIARHLRAPAGNSLENQERARTP